MREFRPSPTGPEPDETPAPRTDADRAPTADAAPAEPFHVSPLFSRRHTPWLLVEVDGSTARHGALIWALREAARREATVLAVSVLDDDLDHPLGAARPAAARDRASALQMLEAQVLAAIAETGVHGRARTAVLDRPVFDAMSAAVSGSDLIIVGASGKTVLRPAVARPPYRRLPRGA